MRVRDHVAEEPMFMANYADRLTDAPLDELTERFQASDAVASMIVEGMYLRGDRPWMRWEAQRRYEAEARR
jgi:NDP-sugar pyrophosphorylase family protein